MTDKTTITIDRELRNQLAALCSKDESFNDAVKKLLESRVQS
jgi:predicted CopG family antitoxin